MDRIYRYLLIAICGVGILFGLQYFLPITAQYLNIKGVSAIPGLPSMPTIVYEATLAPLPLVTLENIPAFTQAGSSFVLTGTARPGGTPTGSPTLTPGATLIPASATRRPVPFLPSFTPEPVKRTATAGGLTPTPSLTPVLSVTSTLITATKTSTVSTPTLTPATQPCNNVLYPLKKGNAWLYQVDARGHSLDLTMVVATINDQQALVDIFNQDSGAASNTVVLCDNGAIRSFPFMQSSIVSNLLSGGGSIDMRYVSGVLAPSLATFVKNSWSLSWTAEYTLSGSASVPFQGQNFNVLLTDSPLTMTCQTAGFEPLSSTNWSTKQALKVICTARSNATVIVNGVTVTGTITGSTTQWFALDVGLLKMQINPASFSTLGFSVPLNVDGRIELLRFQPAP